LLDGISRIAAASDRRRHAEDRMPTVEIEQPSADATFNTPELSDHLLQLFGTHFGTARRGRDQADHGKRGFQPLWLADNPSRA